MLYKDVHERSSVDPHLQHYNTQPQFVIDCRNQAAFIKIISRPVFTINNEYLIHPIQETDSFAVILLFSAVSCRSAVKTRY